MSEIQAGDGWRLIDKAKDTPQKGDQVHLGSNKWVERTTWNEPFYPTRKYRRRIPAKPEPECIGGTSYYCDSNWAAIRETQDTYGVLVTKAASARKLADWLTRYADWREAQESK